MVNLRNKDSLSDYVSPACVGSLPPTIEQGPGLQWTDYMVKSVCSAHESG